jgi:hypothetical protein
MALRLQQAVKPSKWASITGKRSYISFGCEILFKLCSAFLDAAQIAQNPL